MSWTRRELLASMAAAGALPSVAWSFGDPTEVDIAELDLGEGTLSRPNAWKRLLYELTKSTSVEAAPRSLRVKPDDPAMFDHPFCALVGDGAFAPISDRAVNQLSQFLAYGGFLLIDSASDADKGFDASVRRLTARLFPTRPLAPLPGDHSLMRAFFLLDGAPGRVNTHPYVEGITVGNLCPLVYSRNDLSGALDRSDDGRYRHACVPGGERQRREALKVGVNLVMYALTANYKNDQVHVRKLLEEGRL